MDQNQSQVVELEPLQVPHSQWKPLWNKFLSKTVDPSYEKIENYEKLGIQYIHFRSWLVYFFRLKNTILWTIIPRLLWLQLITLGFYLLWFFKVPIPWANSTAHSLLSMALGMLIVLKTNASYDRYYEGRRQWGIIVNHTITMMMTVKIQDSEKLKKMAKWLCAFVYAVKSRLRGCEMCLDDNPHLNEKQVSYLKDFKNPPLQILVLLKKWIHLHSEKSNVDSLIYGLIAAQEACERILSVAIPYCFICHVHHILAIYLITLPYVLISQYEYLTFIFVGLISFSLLGVEAAASEIADPFGNDKNDLPLDEICKSIESNLMNIACAPSDLPHAFS